MEIFPNPQLIIIDTNSLKKSMQKRTPPFRGVLVIHVLCETIAFKLCFL